MSSYGVPFTAILSSMTSAMNVLLIIHRFVCICFPIRSLTAYTAKFTYIQIAVSFSLSTLFELPRFLEYNVKRSNITGYHRTYASDIMDNDHYRFWYKFLFTLIVKKIFPLTIMSVLTFKIVSALKRSQRKSCKIGTMNTIIKKSRDRVTRVMLCVGLLFIISQLPSAIYPIMREFIDSSSISCGFYAYFTNTADFFALTNSAVNFWIYFIVSREFRYKLYAVLRGYTNKTLS